MKPFNKIGTILELGELFKTINPLGPVRPKRSLMAYYDGLFIDGLL